MAFIRYKNEDPGGEDYMEFHDELDNFDVIWKCLAYQEPYFGVWISKKTSHGTSSASATIS